MLFRGYKGSSFGTIHYFLFNQGQDKQIFIYLFFFFYEKTGTSSIFSSLKCLYDKWDESLQKSLLITKVSEIFLKNDISFNFNTLYL